MSFRRTLDPFSSPQVSCSSSLHLAFRFVKALPRHSSFLISCMPLPKASCLFQANGQIVPIFPFANWWRRSARSKWEKAYETKGQWGEQRFFLIKKKMYRSSLTFQNRTQALPAIDPRQSPLGNRKASTLRVPDQWPIPTNFAGRVSHPERHQR